MLSSRSNWFYLISFICAVLIMFVPIFVMKIHYEVPIKEEFQITHYVRPMLFNIGLAIFILANLFIYHKRSWKIGLGLISIGLTVILFGNVVYKAQDQYGFPLQEKFSFIPHVGLFLFPLLIILLILAMKETAKEIFPIDRDDEIKRYGNVT